MPEKLTDAAVRNAKPTSKPQKLFYEEGLFLLVTPTGNKWWRLKYRFCGEEKLLSLGVYPTVTLREARNRRDDAKALLAKGVDPATARKEAEAVGAAKAREQAVTFEAVAREWYDKRTVALSLRHRKKVLSRLENQLFPSSAACPSPSWNPRIFYTPCAMLRSAA